MITSESKLIPVDQQCVLNLQVTTNLLCYGIVTYLV